MTNTQKSDFIGVPGAPGYEINRMGVVIGKKGEPLNHKIVGGYRCVYVSLAGDPYAVRKTLYVHRVLAELFVAKPVGWAANWRVLPLNGIKTDIAVENLEWMDFYKAHAFSRRK